MSCGRAPLSPDDIALSGQPFTGRLQFNFIGATLVDSTGLANGVNCLYKQATATLRASDLPTRPTVLSAVLYVGGSLLGDDGPDYPPSLEIFPTDGISVVDDPDFVTQRAREAADVLVSLVLPGATSATTVNSTTTPAVTVFNKSEGSEVGNIGFFMTRFDITALVTQHGLLQGGYTVSDVLADVCYGTEAVCDLGQNCATQPESPAVGANQGPHTNAAASFGILFVLQDDSLPLRTVGVFEGLEQVSGIRNAVTLSLVNPISDPAAGFLSFYALEGDLLLASAIPGDFPCGGDEFIQVNGSDDGNGPSLCLEDDDNPIGNIFNSTINTEPAAAVEPFCTGPDHLTCCGGDGLCGVTGIDIDRFNISAALTPNAHRVTIEYGTASDRIALGVVAVQVDVFQPTLNIDTQIRALNAIDQQVQVGGAVQYSIAISNTGNVPATNVHVQMSAPPEIANFQVLSVPAGSTNLSTNGAGGDNNTGLVFVQGFDVAAGQIQEIRITMDTTCPQLTHTLAPIATVSSAEITAFEVDSAPVSVQGPGTGSCEGLDPNGSFGDDPSLSPQRVLRGGGGCAAAATPLSVLAGIGLVTLLIRRRRGAR